jgi:hypothetical protein
VTSLYLPKSIALNRTQQTTFEHIVKNTSCPIKIVSSQKTPIENRTRSDQVSVLLFLSFRLLQIT